MIKVTPAAASQVKAASEKTGSDKLLLRIAAKIKPDGSYEYGMGFDEAREEDLRISSEGVDIIVSPDCRELLEDTVLDFVEIAEGKHEFTFFNPNDPDHKAPKE